MCRRRRYSHRTSEAYVYWIRRYILFHRKRHPRKLGKIEVEQFLNNLTELHLSASSQSQALNALVFLYREVLEQPFEMLDRLDRPKRPTRLPTVLSVDQVRSILTLMRGPESLMARLIYGTGMRISECVSLRLKDIYWREKTIHIHAGKGAKDRIALLPTQIKPALHRHAIVVAQLHQDRLSSGRGYAPMPDALGRKYVNASRSLRWQYLFPSSLERREDHTGRPVRWHVSPSKLQRAFRSAADQVDGLPHATVSPLTCCNLVPTSARSSSCLGHSSIETTMIYTHVGQVYRDVRSPLDLLEI